MTRHGEGGRKSEKCAGIRYVIDAPICEAVKAEVGEGEGMDIMVSLSSSFRLPYCSLLL